MKVKKSHWWAKPCIVTPEELERIYLRLKQTCTTFILRSVGRDSVIRDFATLDELCNFENIPKQEIRDLGVNCWSKDMSTSIFIGFVKRTRWNVQFKFEGEEQELEDLTKFLENRMTAMSPWYTNLTGKGGISTVIDLIVIFSITLPLWKVLSKYPVFSNRLYVFFLMQFLMSALVVYLLSKVKHEFFPMTVFEIGQERKRNRDKEVIRKSVIVGFVISIAASIAAALWV
jgi:hypothetical protein